MCREMEQMREEAREEGENRFAKLVRAKDYETLELVTADPKLRGEYYERYGI